MAKGAPIPEGEAFTAAWRRLDRDARRRVRRAANRARPPDDPKEAALAVVVARSQRRFWRYAWLFGPVLAALLLITEELAVVVANAVLALFIFGLLAILFTRRAKLAEEANLAAAAAGGKRKGGRSGAKGKAGAKHHAKGASGNAKPKGKSGSKSPRSSGRRTP